MSPAGKWCDSCTGPHGHIKELRFVSEAPVGPVFTETTMCARAVAGLHFGQMPLCRDTI